MSNEVEGDRSQSSEDEDRRRHAYVARAVARLEQINEAGPVCAMCGKNDWEVLEPLQLQPLVGGGLFSTRVYAVVQIMCANCGNLMLFNAVRLGVALDVEDYRPGSEPSEADQ